VTEDSPELALLSAMVSSSDDAIVGKSPKGCDHDLEPGCRAGLRMPGGGAHRPGMAVLCPLHRVDAVGGSPDALLDGEVDPAARPAISPM
jgi:hypothetical protein